MFENLYEQELEMEILLEAQEALELLLPDHLFTTISHHHWIALVAIQVQQVFLAEQVPLAQLAQLAQLAPQVQNKKNHVLVELLVFYAIHGINVIKFLERLGHA